MVFTILFFGFYPIDFSNAKFEDFGFPKDVMVNVYLSLFLGNMNKLKVQGYSYVPPGFPNSTAQQPRQTRQKGAFQ